MTEAQAPARVGRKARAVGAAATPGAGPLGAGSFPRLVAPVSRGAVDGASSDSFVARLIELDRRSQILDVPISDVQQLRDDIEQAGGPVRARYRWWVDALLAERLLIEGDFGAALWAAVQLGGIPEDPFPPLPVLYGRARLRRLAAVATALVPSAENRARFDDLMNGATDDLLRCGLRVEAVVTTALLQTLMASLTQENLAGAIDRLDDARRRWDGADSFWMLTLEIARAFAAVELGRRALARQSLARIEASPLRHPLIDGLASFLVALGGLLSSGVVPGGTDAVDDALDRVAHIAPRLASLLQTWVAGALADSGDLGARRYARMAADLPMPGAAAAADQRLLDLRLAVLSQEPVELATIERALTDLTDLHLKRRAGHNALRLARDLERVGRPAEATVLRRWGAPHLAPRRERSLWERLWSVPVTPPAGPETPPGPVTPAARPVPPPAGPVTPAAAPLTLHVLQPAATLFVEGRAVPLQAAAAKLLLGLVIAYPGPLHVEQAADLLWPGAEAVTTRARLNSAVFRLRSSLGAQSGRLQRTANMLRFDVAGASVDLVDHRRLLDEPGGRAGALLMVRGNLCGAQFPFDEYLCDARRELVAAWLRHARAALAGGEVEAPALEPALAALDLSPADVL